jgi:CBS domain-containing protein
MATVGDFMNHELVYLASGTRPEIATQPILDFGITSVPVLDEERQPVGMVSLRNLVHTSSAPPAMMEEIVSVRVDESLEDAARKLADCGLHRVVVVDSEGRAVGMLSALDALRGLLGLPPKHPASIGAFGREPTNKNTSAWP